MPVAELHAPWVASPSAVAQEVDRGSQQSRPSLGAWTLLPAQPTKAHISKGGALSVWPKKRNLP